MDRDEMIEIAEAVIQRQDVGDAHGVADSFAEDCTFAMPVLPEPLRGRPALEEHAAGWPKATTETEWVAIDHNRLVLAWRWRGEGEEWRDVPILRGVSTFVFNGDGLIQEYEDFFDPDWATRASAGA